MIYPKRTEGVRRHERTRISYPEGELSHGKREYLQIEDWGVKGVENDRTIK